MGYVWCPVHDTLESTKRWAKGNGYEAVIVKYSVTEYYESRPYGGVIVKEEDLDVIGYDRQPTLCFPVTMEEAGVFPDFEVKEHKRAICRSAIS